MGQESGRVGAYGSGHGAGKGGLEFSGHFPQGYAGGSHWIPKKLDLLIRGESRWMNPACEAIF